jgi:hypothetical protein
VVGKRNIRFVVTQINKQVAISIEQQDLRDLFHEGCLAKVNDPAQAAVPVRELAGLGFTEEPAPFYPRAIG